MPGPSLLSSRLSIILPKLSEIFPNILLLNLFIFFLSTIGVFGGLYTVVSIGYDGAGYFKLFNSCLALTDSNNSSKSISSV